MMESRYGFLFDAVDKILFKETLSELFCAVLRITAAMHNIICTCVNSSFFWIRLQPADTGLHFG